MLRKKIMDFSVICMEFVAQGFVNVVGLTLLLWLPSFSRRYEKKWRFGDAASTPWQILFYIRGRKARCKEHPKNILRNTKMEGWSWVILSIIFGGLMLVFQELWKKVSAQPVVMKWPPGPRKLPIIGNLHQVSKGGEPLHLSLANLAQEYGRMMTIWFGSRKPVIVLSDHELVWEVLVTKTADFSSRTLPYMSKFATADWNTLSSSNLGPHWFKLRKGLHSTAINPKTMSAQTGSQEEDLSEMLFNLHKEASSNDGVVQPLHHFRRLTIQLIGRFCFGPHFRDDSFVDGIDNAIEELIRLAGKNNLVDVFEFTRCIPGLNLPFKQASKMRTSIEELIQPYVASHKLSSSASCYLDFLLSENFSEQIVIFTLFEIFLFAVDSTSATITWGIAFLIHDQGIQQKLYEEIEREVGREAVKVEHVHKLHYLNAVMKETMRMRPIAPLAVPHRAERDSEIKGTKIVAGTTVVVNLHTLMNDPKIWVEPHRFMPERFFMTSTVGGRVDSENTDAMEKSFLPFGAGKRICAGMDLAKLQVAFSIASLVNKFQWSSAVDGQLPDMSVDLPLIVLSMKTPLVARIMSRSS